MFSTNMKLSVGALSLGALLASGSAFAADTMKAVPRFVTLPAKSANYVQAAGSLTTWKMNYAYNGHNYSVSVVGNTPTGAASTTPVFLIPLKIVLSTGQTFSTSTVQGNGQSALDDTVASPIFQKVVAFREGGAKLGKTQYEDAYVRESFWTAVSANLHYHVLLGQPTVLPEVTLNVPANVGKIGTEFGVQVALVDINWLDGQVNTIIHNNSQITPASVPVFMAYNTYETSGGCCIGGWHSATGAQTYMVYDYVGKAGVFSQDVSALSHEFSEWVFDPFINNNSPCGIYEVGDPLEREANYGGYPYTTNGMTYNLQDEAQPPYFGAPPAATLKGRATFQGTKLSVCQNGA